MKDAQTDERMPTKSLIAYEKIRSMILKGTALPGTRLILAELEEKLGVGRGPIRDALLLLDKSGLVQNIPYKGAIVMLPPGYREMELIYQQRCQIELALATEAMRQASEDDIAELLETSKQMDQAATKKEYFFHMDRDFHRQLYQLSRMPHLMSVVDHLMDFVQAFLTLRAFSPEHTALFNQQHGIIIEALKKKDEQLLRDTLKANIMVGLELVRDEMQRIKRNDTDDVNV